MVNKRNTKTSQENKRKQKINSISEEEKFFIMQHKTPEKILEKSQTTHKKKLFSCIINIEHFIFAMNFPLI